MVRSTARIQAFVVNDGLWLLLLRLKHSLLLLLRRCLHAYECAIAYPQPNLKKNPRSKSGRPEMAD